MTDFFDMDLDRLDDEDNKYAKYLKLEDGETTLRLMPPWANGELYYKKFKVHFNIGELVAYGLDSDIPAMSCLKDVTGDKCPVCVVVAKARSLAKRTKNPMMDDLARKLSAKAQYITNVAVVDQNGVAEDEVKIYKFGMKIEQQIRSIFARKKNITHPETGRDIIVSKTVVGGFPNYTVQCDDVCDRSDQWSRAWANNLNDLSTATEYLDLDNVTDLFSHVELDEINSPISTGKDALTDLASQTTKVPSDDDLLSDLESLG